ncbi:hypothetical protein IAR55_005813 [Kwoniella newhampshirensis]|uniref:Zn(2)-C6 fungal-type domain-containing protein n=1 Tax=Kwoniella newhampshirensis TaxID=1651941 RepID=A0AAW0YYI5_9TREE
MATYHPYQPPPSSTFDEGSSVSPDGSAGTSSLPGGTVDGGHGEGGIGKWTNPKPAPVKAACLSCRTKKAKCDGTRPVCGQCSRKGLECVFVKSRRGGARKRRQVIPPTALSEYLKKLDSLLAAPMHNDLGQETIDLTVEDTTNIVRQYSTREEVFQRYYDDVHPFVPVMPPRGYLNMILPTLLPASPFLLATQTILVLVPHPSDPNPKSANSKRLRQGTSNALGAQTLELVESMIANGTANLECIQALVMLSLWEWSNSGSVPRNRQRSSQAIQLAMTMGLNEMDQFGHGTTGRSVEGLDWQRDMARRTWWTVYSTQMVSSIISGTEPILSPDDPRVHVDFPICSIDDHTWQNYTETIRSCARIFALVNSVYYTEASSDASSWGAKSPPTTPEAQDIARRNIVETDNKVLELIKEAERTNIIELVPGGEEEVVRNLQLAARFGLAVVHIHIHRNQAFPEVSLFSKRICGLPQAPDFSMSPSLATPDASQHSELGVQITNGMNGNHYDDGNMYSGESSTSHSTGEIYKHESTNGFDVSTINTAGTGNGNITGSLDMYNNGSYQADWSNGQDDGQANFDFISEMWQPETYPEDLPAPWFTYPGGAASLYTPVINELNHHPASIVTINTPSEGRHNRRLSGSSSLASTSRPHKAWGVDEKADKVLPPLQDKSLDIFPPGISLARCATAAHMIVRLEVLHRSAVMAMWDGPPKWAPFCSCGLVTGAYAFLLLALAVQAESSFSGYTNSKTEEVEALLTNVKVILAGLEAYGVMWGGIDAMAGEVRAALEAATRLPYEVQAQIEATTPVE